MAQKKVVVSATGITLVLASVGTALELGDYRSRVVANLIWIVLAVFLVAVALRLWFPNHPQFDIRPRLGWPGWECEAWVFQETSVNLVLNSRGGKPRRVGDVECRVADPNGNVSRLTTSEHEPTFDERISFHYPHLFATAPRPLRSGTYWVEWRRPGRFRRHRLLGRCSFEISPGQPGWYVAVKAMRLGDQDQVTIFLHRSEGAESLEGLICEVTDLDGQSIKADPEKVEETVGKSAGMPIQATYPLWFEDAKPLRTGRYEGVWWSWRRAAPVGAEGRRELVRRFNFDWPTV